MQARKWSDVLRSPAWTLTAAVVLVIAVGETAMGASDDTDKNWKAKWEKVLRDAKTEGKVVVLGPPVQDVRPSLMSAFKEAFPDVSLEYQPGEFVSMLPRLQAEMAKGKTSIDVIIGGSQPLQHKDVLAPLNERIIVPDAKDPAKWQSSLGKGL